eukprot:2063363-Prorocentrum_lima.AAC.1
MVHQEGNNWWRSHKHPHNGAPKGRECQICIKAMETDVFWLTNQISRDAKWTFYDLPEEFEI